LIEKPKGAGRSVAEIPFSSGDARYRMNDTRCGMDRMIRMVGWLIPESVPCALHLEPYAFVR